MKRVIFRPKSSWQKDDCINRSQEYDCPNESTLEAVCGVATIRCCGEKKCMDKAVKMAKLLWMRPSARKPNKV